MVEGWCVGGEGGDAKFRISIESACRVCCVKSVMDGVCKVEWYNKGMACLAVGDNAQALEVFERVLQHPASLDVRKSQPPGEERDLEWLDDG